MVPVNLSKSARGWPVRQTFAFEGQVTQEDLARPYIYLPFTVPPRTLRLEVSYHFEHRKQSEFGAGGGNNLDLGLFDQRGTDFLSGGFRGFGGGGPPGRLHPPPPRPLLPKRGPGRAAAGPARRGGLGARGHWGARGHPGRAVPATVRGGS